MVFSGVSTDSRRIIKDELFFALCGSNFDGHDFVSEALEKGAKGAVVERINFPIKNGKVIIKVPSALRALGDIASAWRQNFPNLKLAGNAYAGAGIPDCIRSGETAAEQLFSTVVTKQKGEVTGDR